VLWLYHSLLRGVMLLGPLLHLLRGMMQAAMHMPS
jgi:hypothetical protein